MAIIFFNLQKKNATTANRLGAKPAGYKNPTAASPFPASPQPATLKSKIPSVVMASSIQRTHSSATTATSKMAMAVTVSAKWKAAGSVLLVPNATT